MASLDDIRSKLAQNRLARIKLVEEEDTLTWTYVHTQASTPDFISTTLNKVRKYHSEHYTAGSFNEFIALCKDHLTMAPIKSRIYRISKYGTRVAYDTVLYEWNGKRIVYMRADENCDHYYKDCQYFNGFSLEELEISYSDFPQIGWWKMEELPTCKVKDAIEKCVKSSVRGAARIGLDAHLASIPDEYKLIVTLFDMCDSMYHYLLGEDLIEDVVCLMPDVSDV
jgi:hypothetical protein